MALLLLNSCNYFDRKNANKKLVAKVGEKALYEEDFNDIFGGDFSSEDSLTLRASYIQKWIKGEVLFENARKNLTDSLTNKDEQLELYYRSLIRYEYEKGLINQKLDTAVTQKEIEEYYNQFLESFILKRKVCKALFIMLTPDVPKQETAAQWLTRASIENIDSLDKYCLQYGATFNLDGNKWFYVDDVLTEMRLPINYTIQVSTAPALVQDSAKTAIVKVTEVRLPGAQMPMQMAASTIRTIIKNRDKVLFIEKMEKDILGEAERNGLFEMYE